MNGRLSSSFTASYRSIVSATFSLPGRSASIRDFSGQATMASEIANMVKNLIGGGVLSLSGGIALCANTPFAVVPASICILVLGSVFGYYCWLIGKLCKYTFQVTYRELWQDTVGDTGSVALPFVNGEWFGGEKQVLAGLDISLLSPDWWQLSRQVLVTSHTRLSSHRLGCPFANHLVFRFLE
jgi:hypothetical protein